MQNVLAGYLLAAMQAWSPLSGHDYARGSLTVSQARMDTELRYESIARDLEYAANVEDPFWDGPTGRAQSAILVLAIASYESGGFRVDVDREDRPTGDGGHAWCLGQLHDSYAAGLTDRVSCFRGMFRAIHDSMRMCRSETWDPAYQLSGYTVGHCEVGEAQASHRAARATRWWALAPWLPPVKEDKRPASE
jgi:hypothetical protein